MRTNFAWKPRQVSSLLLNGYDAKDYFMVINYEEKKMMTKKKRVMAVFALTMMVAVLAAGMVHAQS